MRENQRFEEIDEHSRRVISFKAQQLVGHYGFTQSDVEDIEQDLSIHLANNLCRHNPSRGARTTFVETVLNNMIRRIISEGRQSGSYDYRLVGRSLDDYASTDGEGTLVLGDVIDLESSRVEFGRRMSEAEEVELKVDLEKAINALSPDLRDLCFRLANQDLLDVIRETGIPRHKIQWMRKKIMRVFVRYGINPS